MESPLYIALSRQSVLRRQLDILAHNVANMGTTGFRAQRPQFAEFLERPTTRESYSLPIDLLTTRDPRPGPMIPTGNTFDVALQGEGYFTVQTLSGDRYTRSGNFTLDPDRRLVDSGGLPVLDTNGQTITIPNDVASIVINRDGSISSEQGQIAQIGVVRFENDQLLEELGNGLFATEQPPIPIEFPAVVQSTLEGSNVQPIFEMTQMVEVLRQYQAAQRLLDSEHERQRTAIRQITRVPGGVA